MLSLDMNDKVFFVAFLCVATSSLALIWKRKRSGAKLPFPPGPKGLPLLGNVLDIPKDVPIWVAFTSTAQKFNTDVLYLRVLTTDMVVLNSTDAVSDLCDKRSNIYSDKPSIPMAEMMGASSWIMSLMKYGNEWRNARRLLHEFMNPRAVTTFDDYQRKHAYRFLLRLAETPGDFLNHIEFSLGALIMEITYGINIVNNKNQFLRAIVVAVEILTSVLVPGRFLVDSIPILKYVPEWFPGAGFKTTAREVREMFDIAVRGPLEHVKESMKSNGGGSNPSIAWACLDRALGSADQEFDEGAIRAVTGTMYIAAVAVVSSTVQAFFLAMALNPHVAKKAQEQLDRVLGGERLPDFSDQEDLPYISAIIKEAYRWGCSSPIGVPKRVMEDDIYNGYFIPAGATIVDNMWAMFYDESVYPAPYQYDPERYIKDGKLDHSVKDPEERVFGSSRRECPGRLFATRLIFLNIACILTLFNIEAPSDEKLEAKFIEGSIIRRVMISRPLSCGLFGHHDGHS